MHGEELTRFAGEQSEQPTERLLPSSDCEEESLAERKDNGVSHISVQSGHPSTFACWPLCNATSPSIGGAVRKNSFGLRFRAHRSNNITDLELSPSFQREAHPTVWLGETPRRLTRKRCRYSSLEKFEDAFDTELRVMRKPKACQDK